MSLISCIIFFFSSNNMVDLKQLLASNFKCFFYVMALRHASNTIVCSQNIWKEEANEKFNFLAL